MAKTLSLAPRSLLATGKHTKSIDVDRREEPATEQPRRDPRHIKRVTVLRARDGGRDNQANTINDRRDGGLHHRHATIRRRPAGRNRTEVAHASRSLPL